MATRSYETLVDQIYPSVSGCPFQTILQHVRESAVRACERSLAWRYQIPLFRLMPGVHEYAYEVPADTKVHAMFEALVNGYPLERLTLEQAIRLYPEWADLYSGEPFAEVWSETPSLSGFGESQYNDEIYNANPDFVPPDSVTEGGGTPRSICQLTPNKYIVLPLPDAEEPYQMRMFVALKPTRSADGMDDVILSELEDAIIHDVLTHLMTLPNAAWTDYELAAYHAKQFAYQISERRARANLGNMRGVVRARMQPFGV